MSKADLHRKLDRAYEVTLSVKVENQAEIFLVQSGLFMKVTLYICFLCRALIPTGIRTS